MARSKEMDMARRIPYEIATYKFHVTNGFKNKSAGQLLIPYRGSGCTLLFL
ncbi:MAG: hypothetical protein ONB46_18925 [candidate division KSB1 bacterium]|nr:hypothetical protein [candidate division KSB1 bacterium]MDZ7367966.1 hypothetical protein [candidate division KSB1 bacterium]MDZ7405589.1 hypothetical protein [candidate division KSB1 bacterium]